jgi:alkyl hydroperoxide reductase subunit F
MLTADIENYMGYQFVTGPELMDRFEEQTRHYKVEMATGKTVTRLGMRDQLKSVVVQSGEAYLGRAVIIASGKRSRALHIPGEGEYAGRGVSYCATCDGPLYAGETVMVAGGGNSGMQAALEMSAICPHVHLVSLTRLTGDEVLAGKVLAEDRICKHILWQPSEVKGDASGVTSVVITSDDGKDTKEIEVKALFVEVGLQPNSSFAVDLLELNRKGEIVVDCDCRTGVKGIFAAGDVTQVRDKQIVVAAGEGAKAALSAHEYLLTQR